MKKEITILTALVRVHKVSYHCPHCGEFTEYETDGLPPKEECHKCLKPLKFIVNYLEDK